MPTRFPANSNPRPRDATGRATPGEVADEVVAAIAIAALVISGLRLIATEAVTGQFRAWMIRRATGRQLHFANGRLRERALQRLPALLHLSHR